MSINPLSQVPSFHRRTLCVTYQLHLHVLNIDNYFLSSSDCVTEALLVSIGPGN